MLARACNEFGAKLVQAHPTRFGLFATLPLPDVDASLKEIAYAYDTLKADGIGLLTSYDDVWLGNKAFRPVMEELNRRKAVVAVHPTAANCCRNLEYGRLGPGSIEYGTDTTRAIIGVAFSGDATRFPEIRFIWSHAGGSLPFLAGRIDGGRAARRKRCPTASWPKRGSSITTSPVPRTRAPSRRCFSSSNRRRSCSGPISLQAAPPHPKRRRLRPPACSAKATCAPSTATTRFACCHDSRSFIGTPPGCSRRATWYRAPCLSLPDLHESR